MDEQQTIQLQGIGRVAAIPASQLVPGMLLSWNYTPLGFEVVSVREKSPQFLEIVERDRKTLRELNRTIKKTKLVAARFPPLVPYNPS